MAEFDDYADSYLEVLKENQGAFGEEISYYAEHKAAILKQRAGRVQGRILDFGCGIGRNIGPIRSAFPEAEVLGCDVSDKSLDVARELNPEATFFSLNVADDIAPRDGFALVLVACVFHHVPPAERVDCLTRISDFLGPAGQAFIFEHNPYNPLTRHLVNTCPLDVGAELLSAREMAVLVRETGLKVVRTVYTLFLPARLRRLAPLERLLGWLPLGGQYYLQVVKPG